MAKKRAKLTPEHVEAALRQRLPLREPRFFLERIGPYVVGHIVSSTFKGKGDRERLKLVADALETALGPDGVDGVGMLFALTPDEWELEPVQPMTAPKRRKKAGKAA